MHVTLMGRLTRKELSRETNPPLIRRTVQRLHRPQTRRARARAWWARGERSRPGESPPPLGTDPIVATSTVSTATWSSATDSAAPGDAARARDLIAAGRAEAEQLGMARELLRFERLTARLAG
jgi:hypothetical protein